MSSDRQQILRSLGVNPTMGRVLSVAKALDRAESDEIPVRFAIVRNITLEPGLPAALIVEAAKRGLRASVKLGEFDAAQQETLLDDSFIYRNDAEIVVIVQDLQVLSPRLVHDFNALSSADVADLVKSTLRRVSELVFAVRERSNAMILVNNFIGPVGRAQGILDPQSANGQRDTIRQLNAELARDVATVASTYVVDIDYTLSQIGYESAIDDRYWHIARAPYSFTALERIACEYAKFAAALKGKAKKCVVFDCDNTLWGGIVGEDGIEGIKLGSSYPGSAFVELHFAILNLYRRGVLLAINSKNNKADVFEVLEKHPDSILKPEHFVITKINWEDKVSNLVLIAAELNIGIDSLVFVDDNPFECERVREALPDVAVVEFAQDPSRFARTIRELPYFDTLSVSGEDRQRSEMYRSENRRSELKSSARTVDEYLRSLDMKLKVTLVDSYTTPRVAQLTQKTNQFNLTTRRYSEADIARMASDQTWRLYCAELTDKFGAAGIIAVAIVHDLPQRSIIDTLLMSCRVIGRGVEQAVLAHVARETQQRGQQYLAGEYIATPKNSLAAEFYQSSGFSKETGVAGTMWVCDLYSAMPKKPAWFVDSESNALLVTP